ncbi:transmembrane protein, putative (macronuclear) [Tetrahymena thermophila SB210]|uniref:Transmembrane protein, putative n=1 Tax=Tetrahymena thermophila (strain SB210) TaxID=312017 RepID=W7XBV4_TETTS|nr:transmembrane protein, putative [Tetrahymena thermophila SB210]EWS74807.1 transmembrane protein, putative [Tetrahymena thermophila SB210]|eukprot:XP_012652700.1 transmembrane protein, putative [Tetrahymena thermophila SB210]
MLQDSFLSIAYAKYIPPNIAMLNEAESITSERLFEKLKEKYSEVHDQNRQQTCGNQSKISDFHNSSGVSQIGYSFNWEYSLAASGQSNPSFLQFFYNSYCFFCMLSCIILLIFSYYFFFSKLKWKLQRQFNLPTYQVLTFFYWLIYYE